MSKCEDEFHGFHLPICLHEAQGRYGCLCHETMQVPGSKYEQLIKGYHRFHCYSGSLIEQVQAYLLLDHQHGIESAAIMWGSKAPCLNTR